MKIAKPSAESLKKGRAFISACELMLEKEKFSMKDAYENWEDLDEDDPDKLRILMIRKSIAANEDIEESEIDSCILAYEYLRDKYTNRMGHLHMCLEVLMDNCCDPTEDCLEFHPSFEQLHVAPEQ